MDRYSQASKISKTLGEHNDCTVKALSITADISYAQAHKLLKKHGRKDRRGCTKGVQYAALKELGYVEKIVYRAGDYNVGGTCGTAKVCSTREFIDHYPSPHKARKNLTVGQAHLYADTVGWKALAELSKMPGVVIMLWTRGHVSAYKNGRVEDWAADGKKRIDKIGVFYKDAK